MGLTWAGNGKPTGKIVMRKAEAIVAEVRREVDGIGRDMQAEAVRLSSGPYSLKQLRRMGHPYSRRRPNPGAIGGDFARINVQTGVFRKSWSMRVSRAFGSTYITMWNRAPHKIFLPPRAGLQGRSKMVVRAVYAAIVQQTVPRIDARLRRAIRKGLRA
jgi:hypothetical protein